jgi:antitoxin component YwqK of YwqJK toxin-antitoxin module
LKNFIQLNFYSKYIFPTWSSDLLKNPIKSNKENYVINDILIEGFDINLSGIFYYENNKKNGITYQFQKKRYGCGTAKLREAEYLKHLQTFENIQKEYKIDIECFYKNNQKNGRFIQYYNYPDSKKKLCYYKNDNLNGEYQEWYITGKKYIYCSFINNIVHGKYYEWYGIENKSFSLNYNNGRLEGKFEKWYPLGNINIECYFKNHKIHGKYLEFYENGNLQIECNFSNGNLNGLYKEYYENGEKKLICNIDCQFINGKNIF